MHARVIEGGVTVSLLSTRALPFSFPRFTPVTQATYSGGRGGGGVRGSSSALTTNSVELFHGSPDFNPEATLVKRQLGHGK